MSLSRTEESLLCAAYFRGRRPEDQGWVSNSDQILTLSLFFTGDISFDDCATRFSNRGYIKSLYDKAGELTDEITHRYTMLIDLLREHPDLIEGGGDFEHPADPTYTACGLTAVGQVLALQLIPSLPQKPEFPNWPDKRTLSDH